MADWFPAVQTLLRAEAGCRNHGVDEPYWSAAVAGGFAEGLNPARG
jgi:hypothetical protein